MPASFEVTCITKRQHYNPHERIAAIGGATWYLPEDQAISGLMTGKFTLYVTVNGQAVQVIVAHHLGRPYLKTQTDGYAPNNLLNLPDCVR
jgi:hypothetical protein